MIKRPKPAANQAKILFLDVENSPSLGYYWQKFDTDIVETRQDWYMLSFAYKWLGEKKVTTHCLIDYPEFAKDVQDDSALINDLWSVIDAADIVIGHNLDRFDIRKANTRFITHGLPPPSPYKTVDTLKLARKVFRFDSNKLDELGRCLRVGRKLPHIGFQLWLRCMHGDKKSWRVMRKYNAHDVTLLEEIYNLMLAWNSGHPNVNKGQCACPKCGSRKVQKRGFSYTLLRKKQRLQCLICRGWFEGPAVQTEREFNED